MDRKAKDRSALAYQWTGDILYSWFKRSLVHYIRIHDVLYHFIIAATRLFVFVEVSL